MRAFLKIVIAGILLLLVLVGGGVALFHNQLVAYLKPSIEQELSRLAEEQLQYERATLSLWPPLGLAVEGVTIGNSSAKRYVGSVRSITARLNIASLLAGAVVVEALELTEPNLTIRSGQSSDQRAGTAAETVQAPPPSITLSQFRIRDGRIALDPEGMQFNRVNLSARIIVESGEVKVENGSFSGEIPLIGPVQAQVQALGFDQGSQRLTLSKVQGDLLGGTVQLEGTAEMAQKNGAFQASWSALTVNSLLPLGARFLPADLSVQSGGSLSGEGTIRLVQAKPSFNGSLTVTDFRGRYKNLPFTVSRLALAGDPAGKVVIQESEVRVAEALPLKVQGGADLQQQSVQVQFSLPRTAAEKVASTAALLDIALPAKASGDLSLSGSFERSSSGVNSWQVASELYDLTVDHPTIKVAQLSGTVAAQGSGSRIVVESKQLAGVLEPGAVPFTAKGRTTLPSGEGVFHLVIPDTRVAQVLPLLARFGISAEQLGSSGSFSVTADGEGAKTVSAVLSLNDLSSSIGGYAVTKITGKVPLTVQQLSRFEGRPELTFSLAEHEISARGTVAQRPGALSLDALTVQGFGGALTAHGVIREGSELQKFELTGGGHELAQLARAFLGGKAPDLTGKVQRLGVQLQGPLRSFPFPELGGGGSLQIVQAVLKGVNLPKTVVESLEQVPFLTGKIRNSFPPEYEGELQKPDTTFPELGGSFVVRRGQLETDTLLARGEFYSVTGQGSIGLDGTLDLTTQLVFDKAFSAALVREARDTARILNARGQIEVPVRIRGPVRSLSIQPDLQRLIQNAGERLIQQEAGKLLEGLLGGGRNREGTRK